MSKKVKIILAVAVIAAIGATVYYYKVYKPKQEKKLAEATPDLSKLPIVATKLAPNSVYASTLSKLS